MTKIEFGDKVLYRSSKTKSIPCEVVGIRKKNGIVASVEIEGEFVGEKGRVQKMWVPVEYIDLE